MLKQKIRKYLSKCGEIIINKKESHKELILDQRIELHMIAEKDQDKKEDYLI